MKNDILERRDVEHAVLNGAIEKRLHEDYRGMRYCIVGPATDGRAIRVICRLGTDGRLIILRYMNKNAPIICEYCSGKTIAKTVTRQHWLDGRLYIVENVDAEVCEQCGERYFEAMVLARIDALLRGKHDVKSKMVVEVVSL